MVVVLRPLLARAVPRHPALLVAQAAPRPLVVQVVPHHPVHHRLHVVIHLAAIHPAHRLAVIRLAHRLAVIRLAHRLATPVATHTQANAQASILRWKQFFQPLVV